jgi:hypothetical protein
MPNSESTIYPMILLALAVGILPVGFLSLCVVMAKRDVHRTTVRAYFFLFGTVGGWCLAFALSPSGLAAMCIMFLLMTSPVCLVSSLFLRRARKDRNRFDSVAMYGGYAYSVLFAVYFASAAFLSGQ